MRIALISDIHANLPALEAVLDDIDAAGHVDQIVHLGDLVGYAPWPNETVELIRSRGIVGVAGNYDSTVATGYAHCGCQYEDAKQEALAHESYAWTGAAVSAAARSYLRQLPFRLDLRPAGGHTGGPRLCLVHGTPTRNTLYWHEDRTDAFCTKMAGIAGVSAGDMIAFGHTHKPWQRTIDGVLFLNTGSVGRPKDGDWRAGYAVATVDESITAEFRRVEYDVERTAAAIESSALPDEFAHYLRSGGKSTAALA